MSDVLVHVVLLDAHMKPHFVCLCVKLLTWVSSAWGQARVHKRPLRTRLPPPHDGDQPSCLLADAVNKLKCVAHKDLCINFDTIFICSTLPSERSRPEIQDSGFVALNGSGRFPTGPGTFSS